MKKSFVILLAVFLINIPASYFKIYDRYYWTDQLMHFSGGFFVAMFMYYYLADNIRSGAWIKNMLVIVGATALVGVLWEFAEYTADHTVRQTILNYLDYNIRFGGNLTDTLSDLFFDIFGATCLWTIFRLAKPGR